MTTPLRVKSPNNTQLKTSPAVGYTRWGFLTRFVIYNCVVSAVLLPVYASNSFNLFNILRGPDKAKVAEAKGTIGAVNRSQQAYYLEKNRFSNSMADLNTNLPSETKNYQFEVLVPPQNGPMQAVEPNTLPIGAIVTARAKDPTLQSVTGVVSLVPNPGKEATTVVGMCMTSKPSDVPPILPKLQLISRRKGQQNTSPSNIRTICPLGSQVVR